MQTREGAAGHAALTGAERIDRLLFAAFQLPFTGFLVATFVREGSSSTLRWCTSLSWFVGLLAVFEALEHLSVVRAVRQLRAHGQLSESAPEAAPSDTRRRLRRVLLESLLGTLLLTSASLSL